MPSTYCDACSIDLECTDTDSRGEWCEWTYVCPRCKALYIHRREFDQNGLVTSDTFERKPLYKRCLNEHCGDSMELTGETDSREDWVSVDYHCPKCKTLYTHRKEFDENDNIIKDIFFEKIPNPKKEDAVREALGVEKKFDVYISIPTTGTVHMAPLTVMAVNKDEAKKKAIELTNNGGADINDADPREDDHNYEYAPEAEWDIDVS